MARLQELLAQKAALEKEIAETQREDRSNAIAQVRALMAQHNLSVADLSGRAAPARAAGGEGRKVAPKYRNRATGDTWTGRGLQPNWLKAELERGRKLEDFAV